MSRLLPGPLVDTDWLEARLGDIDLRIYDCTVLLDPDATGGPTFTSGRAQWELGHIPGSGFADLLGELSRHSDSEWFMLPDEARFAREMGRLGVGETGHVVVYDSAMNIYAARLWWLLRVFGFERVSVLDGGWRKWRLEGRPVSVEAPRYPAAAFVAKRDDGRIADKRQVFEAIGRPRTCLVNGVAAEQHRGGSGLPVGRLGHIPGSVSVPFDEIVDRATHAYLPEHELRAVLQARGVLDAEHLITYCAAGVAAASDALVLALLGRDDVALYDGSLREWAQDPDLPLELG